MVIMTNGFISNPNTRLYIPLDFELIPQLRGYTKYICFGKVRQGY